MIDLKKLHNNFTEISALLKNKGVDETILTNLNNLYISFKEKKQLTENISFEQKTIGQLFDPISLEKKKELKVNKQLLETELSILEDKLNSLLKSIPNIPDTDVPFGLSENDNIVLKEIGIKPVFSFKPKEHFDLPVDWLDFKRGVKLAKTRFSALKNDGAILERALINYMLHFNRQRGFNEWSVPVLANSSMLEGTGQLPKFENDLFKIDGEDLYLIPTAEVALTNLFNNEIIDKKDLPLLLTSCTPCFRKEAGSAGRDTKGLLRQHQFNKVELVAISNQEDSDAIFQMMVDTASNLLLSLGIYHRQVLLCSGDLGFSAAKTIDLEVWLPGQNRFREIASISNTRDFQSRRAKIRYKDNNSNLLAHTLNGSSLAVGRTLLAIMENFQTEDGNVIIPDVLKPYL